jgi:hypothetical protein
MFKSYTPVLHEHYHSTMEKLSNWDPLLTWNLDPLTSVFAAATFNFDPHMVFPHLDFANLVWGWCSITALGNFDPNKGRHLILWDLCLIICFPPGSTIMIPSAILCHSNVSIQQGEKCFSFMQFSAAGLFRFICNGFQMDKVMKNSGMTTAEKKKRMDDHKKRWVDGLNMYSKWNVAFE